MLNDQLLLVGLDAESSSGALCECLPIDFYLHTYFQLIVIKLTLRRVQISGSLGKHFACDSLRPPVDVNINSIRYFSFLGA